MKIYHVLMNRGFLIFEDNTKFVLAKMPTPADPRHLISDETHTEAAYLKFETFDAALTAAKVLIDWKEDTTTNTQDSTTTWKLEMMYCHKGLGVKFVDLGEMGTTSFANAKAEAQRRGEAYVQQSDLEKVIVNFEVRVRPCRKQN